MITGRWLAATCAAAIILYSIALLNAPTTTPFVDGCVISANEETVTAWLHDPVLGRQRLTWSVNDPSPVYTIRDTADGKVIWSFTNQMARLDNGFHLDYTLDFCPDSLTRKTAP